VEEGYVFASLVNLRKISRDHQAYDLFAYHEKSLAAELVTSNRNQGEIYALAQALLTQDAALVAQILATGEQVKLYPAKLGQVLNYLFTREDNPLLNYLDSAQLVNEISLSSIKQLFAQLNQQAVLCLTNRGVLGCDNLNLQIERRIKQQIGHLDTWYSGRPIIILQNDYNLELFNGDIGICVLDGDKVQIVFENGRQFIPEVLPAHSLAYAITIHKSQGSEYQQVNLVLPEMSQANEGTNLLSRELVYTGVTRAKSQVTIFSSQDLILQAMANHIQRNTGLSNFFKLEG
jgi:exodeoxyribonuclease V alpha subunit